MVVSARDVCHTKGPAPLAWGFFRHTGTPSPGRLTMSLARFSVNNRVLVNMLMLVILLAGGIFAFTLVREFFPESRPNKVRIAAVYPGQQPEEIEFQYTLGEQKALINVGSVGQPRDRNPLAAYVIYDLEKQTVTMHRVEYEKKEAQQKIRAAGLPFRNALRLDNGR